MLIDTHCHLDFSQFDTDREKVIQRAIRNKVNRMITIGTDLNSSQKAIELAEKFAVIYAAIGIHPNDCLGLKEKHFDQLQALSAHDKVVAIGEIGLDYYRMNIPAQKQHEVFKIQVKLAHSLKLPLIIHNRDAHDDLYRILIDEHVEEFSGVLHSFTGDEHFLESVLALNFYVSFTGSITFKNAGYDTIIEKVPLERLLLETDSPFLTPVPFRGRRNEPAYLKYISDKIAQVKKISTADLAKIATENARRLFKKIL